MSATKTITLSCLHSIRAACFVQSRFELDYGITPKVDLKRGPYWMTIEWNEELAEISVLSFEMFAEEVKESFQEYLTAYEEK